MTHARDGLPHMLTIRHRARVLSDRETRCWIAKVRRDKRAARTKRLEKARSARAMARILRNAQRRGAMPAAQRELHWVVEAAELHHWSNPPKRRRERVRAALQAAYSTWLSWRSRENVCGQCNEYHPENPCGNPCNLCPF